MKLIEKNNNNPAIFEAGKLIQNIEDLKEAEQILQKHFEGTLLSVYRGGSHLALLFESERIAMYTDNSQPQPALSLEYKPEVDNDEVDYVDWQTFDQHDKPMPWSKRHIMSDTHNEKTLCGKDLPHHAFCDSGDMGEPCKACEKIYKQRQQNNQEPFISKRRFY